MGFEYQGQDAVATVTSPLVWTLQSIKSVATSGDRLRLKNFFVRGVYSIDQASEVNLQHGLLFIGLLRFPDTVSTPDPDAVEGGSGSVDHGFAVHRTVWAQGQNNPVLWTMRFRAINVNPGQKLFLAHRIQLESGASLNHRVFTSSSWFESDD